MSKVVLLIFLIILSSSCFNQGDCLITASGFMRVDFYERTTRQPKLIKFDSVFTSGTDLVFALDTTTLLLPVNPRDTITRFVMYHDGRADSIIVTYSSETRIIAPDCGAFTYYKDLGPAKSNIEPNLIRLINTQLLRDPVHQTYATNLEIFF